MSFSDMTVAQSMAWQTTTAAVQAICSVSLLGWYLWSAHSERQRTRREKHEAYASLVMLCRDLGLEAKARTATLLAATRVLSAHGVDVDVRLPPDVADTPAKHFDTWRDEMIVIYVCLNEVPHYEVRSPSFSASLTRLWLEVDARAIRPDAFVEFDRLVKFLDRKQARIGEEVDKMSALLSDEQFNRRDSLPAPHHGGRRGRVYGPQGGAQPLQHDGDLDPAQNAAKRAL